MKSPIKGMNLIAFIAADFLFLVIAYNMPVTMALGMSPIGGIPRIGPAARSIASAITDIVRATTARDMKSGFATFNAFTTYIE